MNKLDNLYNFALSISDTSSSNLTKLLDNIDGTLKKIIQKELLIALDGAEITSTLTDTGITTEKSFFSEISIRFNKQLLSPLYPKNDLRSLLDFKLNKKSFSFFLTDLSTNDLKYLFGWLINDSPKLYNLLGSKLDYPLRVLTARLTYYGTTWQIQSKLLDHQELRDCFFNTENSLSLFISEPTKDNFNLYMNNLTRCKHACKLIRLQRKENGISLDITHRLIKINDIIERIHGLAILKIQPLQSDFAQHMTSLTQKVVYAHSSSSNISKFIFESLELVFYEITEHTGKVGKKYVLSNKAGYYQMLKKGALGGVIVGLLAILKPIFTQLNMSPFIEFINYGAIYSLIFLLIYFLKGALATKQPAMTASRIAQILDKNKTATYNISGLDTLIKDIFRTQFVAIFANLVLALPVAAALYYILKSNDIFSLSDSMVLYLKNSLHPFYSATLIYAALTGVCLAISGVVAGAIRNWYIFNQINSRLHKLLGRNGSNKKFITQKYIIFLDKHLDGLTSNISLGILLGFISSIGKATGIPIDARHITFASAQMGFSFIHNLDNFLWSVFILTFFSVVLIGLINLFVSFNLTLFIALRSRRISLIQFKNLIKACHKDFIKNPLSYFIPRQ